MVCDRLFLHASIASKPQSHRIVRFLDRTIGCDLANVRPIGNVSYDLQKRRILRSVFFAGGRSSYDWSYEWTRDQQRLEKIDGKIHRIVGNRTTNGSHKRSIVRSIVAPDDRSYDQSWNSATANRRKNVRLVAEVVLLVADVVGDRNGQTSRNKVDGDVQNLKPAIPNRKRSHD